MSEQNRQRELEYFCRQYAGKRAELGALFYPAGGTGSGIRPGQPGDPTGERVIRRERLLQDIELIEKCACDAAAGSRELARAILARETAEPRARAPAQEMPPGWRTLRARFYRLLDARRG